LLLNKDGWQSRWVKSDWKKSEGKAGSFKHAAGKWPGDPDDKGKISLLAFDSFPK
jgi:calreticulin